MFLDYNCSPSNIPCSHKINFGQHVTKNKSDFWRVERIVHLNDCNSTDLTVELHVCMYMYLHVHVHVAAGRLKRGQ